MTEREPIKLSLGTWGRLPLNDERTPKVTFDLNIPETVVFLTDDPEEREGDSGAYYTFPVKHGNIETVIQTSSITLLAQLKKYYPLTGKTLKITKKIEKNKQYFVVELLSESRETKI